MAEKYYVPWIRYEQIDFVGAEGLKESSLTIFRNNGDKPIYVDRVLLDSNDVTDVNVRYGILGQQVISRGFTSSLAIHNVHDVMNSATDGAWPLLKFAKPVLAAPKQEFSVTLQDLVGGGARVATVQMYGYRLCKPSEPVIFTTRAVIPDAGQVAATVDTDRNGPCVLTDLALYIEETGSVANLRGLRVSVSGGAMPAWMNVAARGTVVFPHSNPGAAIWAPGGDFILEPGASFLAEFFGVGGVDRTLYLGVVGYSEDRRS